MSNAGDLTDQLLGLRRGRELKAFRRMLTKQQAIEAVTDPRVSPVDRAALNLAVAFASSDEAMGGPYYHWSPAWGFGDSMIFPPEPVDADQTPPRSDQGPAR